MLGLLEPADDGIDNVVVEYDRRGVGAKTAVGFGGDGGGGVDDISKRISSLEIQVSSIAATIPHLATAASVAEILAVIPHLATKADLKNEISGVRTEIGEVRTEIAEVRTEIAGVRTEIAGVRTEVSGARTDLRAEIAEVKTGLRTEIAELRTDLRTEISEVKIGLAAMEAQIIKWFIATSLTSVGLAFTIAKLIH